MPQANTASFVTEVELLPTGKQAKSMRARFEAARQVYNACLGELLKREKLMRESKAWQRPSRLNKVAKSELATAERRLKAATNSVEQTSAAADVKAAKERKKEATETFRQCAKMHGFRKYDLHKWTTQFTRSWINEHLGARTVEAIASTAWKTVENFVYAAGSRKRPKFRRKGDIRSVDGKTKSCCHWKADRIEWKGLKVPAKIGADDPVIQHGLKSTVKYVRMVRRVIRDRERFFAQLVCEGEPYRKPAHAPNPGVVGIDVGTQTIAAVGDRKAFLDVFCEEIVRDHKQIRRIQRAMDRSRRSMNPENFNDDGTVKKNAKEWKSSRRYQQLRKRLSDLLRRESDHRKNLHGQLVARVLKLGDLIKTEKLQFQSLARKAKRDGNKRRKRFGKSIASRAPGMFLSRLKNEAAKWGGAVEEFSTRTTKLSQTCHCGHVRKKSLGQRVHNCPKCGAFAQRDLYSAFLARFVESNTLHADDAQQAWSGTCAALETAWDEVKQANGIPSSLGLRDRDRAARFRNGDGTHLRHANVVAAGQPAGESRGEDAENRHYTTFVSPESVLISKGHSGAETFGTKHSHASGADTG